MSSLRASTTPTALTFCIRKYQACLIIWMCFMCQCVLTVEAQTGGNTARKQKSGNKAKADEAGSGASGKKKKRAGKVSDRSTGDPYKGVWFVTRLLLLCFVPPIFMFLKNVWNDPMTPTLIANGWDMFKERLLGFLGKSRRDEQNESNRKMQ